MRLAGSFLLMAALLLLAAISPAQSQRPVDAFQYVHSVDGDLAARVSIERHAATSAAEAGEAERWAVTVLLLIEMSRGSSDAIERGFGLDAALAQLTRHDARALIASLSDDRRRSLDRALRSLDPNDPVGLRGYTDRLARRRLDVVTRDVLEASDPFAGLDTLLALHGQRQAGVAGPRGRQRARDRKDYRNATRHEVFRFEGLTRWHLMLPPTEALEGMPLEELDRKWQRARNLAVHSDRLWAHQDGPRLHDMLLHLMLMDATGIVRLVHADTQRLAHADRERRWRLREAIARLEP